MENKRMRAAESYCTMLAKNMLIGLLIGANCSKHWSQKKCLLAKMVDHLLSQ